MKNTLTTPAANRRTFRVATIDIYLCIITRDGIATSVVYASLLPDAAQAAADAFNSIPYGAGRAEVRTASVPVFAGQKGGKR